MAISTVGDLIALALKDSGVVAAGQTPLAEDSNDSLTRLNMMLAQWSRRRWLVYNLIDTYIQSTGALSYTVGPSGNFNIPRPAQINASFARMQPGPLGQPGPSSVDYPLELIDAREDWNKIAVKAIASFPYYFFYDSGYPLGRVYFWPVPQNIYELHITAMAPIASFTGLAQAINLPPEYHEALFYNLMQRFRVAYRLPADAEINGLARAALETLRVSNTQIPRLSVPQVVSGRGRYNIFSDQTQ